MTDLQIEKMNLKKAKVLIKLIKLADDPKDKQFLLQETSDMLLGLDTFTIVNPDDSDSDI